MPLTPGNSNGTLNGTTEVDVVAAPAASTQRMVRNITFFNRDASSVEITLKYDDNGVKRHLDKQSVAAGQAWKYEVLQVLDDTNDKLTAVLTAAPTTQPDFVANWADKS